MQLTDEFRSKVQAQLDDALLADLGSLAAMKKRLHARLEELDAKEDQYLELVGTPGWPKDKIRRKLDSIHAEREQISTQLSDATGRLEAGRAFFLAALELLRDPKTFYEQGGTSLKRAMNKIVFTKLYVDGEEISGHELAEPVRDLVHAQRLVIQSGGVKPATQRAQTAQNTPAAPPVRAGLRGRNTPERTC